MVQSTPVVKLATGGLGITEEAIEGVVARSQSEARSAEADRR